MAMYTHYHKIKGICKCSFDAHSDTIYVYDNIEEVKGLSKDFNCSVEHRPTKANKVYEYNDVLVIENKPDWQRTLERMKG